MEGVWEETGKIEGHLRGVLETWCIRNFLMGHLLPPNEAPSINTGWVTTHGAIGQRCPMEIPKQLSWLLR
jgi:hypothetical protein